MKKSAPQATTEQRYERIWRVVAAVPAGQVVSYGQVAELAGIPRGARQVGRALGHAPAALDLPWHRVVASSGKLSLPPASSGFRTQRARLLSEGVAVQSGRVNMRRFRWLPSLDEVLWRM